MGAATLLPVFCCCCSPSSSSTPIAATLLISSPPLPRTYPKTLASFHFSRSITGPALGTLPPWNGLKKHATPMALRNFRKDKKGKFRGKVVYASLFGVGAPEALVIGVVALLVFGPKGLAEVARNLGKTLRAFQPTIKELQEVSREFKNTLEREIGIDEIASSTNYINKSALYADEKQEATIDPNGKPPIEPYSSEDLLKVTEAQLAASASQTEATPKEQTQGAASKFEESTPKDPPQEPLSETSAASSLKETNAAEADVRVQSSDET